MISLYLPEKYKVFVGQGKTIGLCTAWNEPGLIFSSSETIKKNTAIVGSLYSRQGVNIILRNLALNPTIKKLLVWTSGKLSNSEYGKSGSSVLFALWKNGISDDGVVNDSGFKLEPEITPEIVRRIISNVTLQIVPDADIVTVEKIVASESNYSDTQYMEPVSFKEHVYSSVSQFPSEDIGWLIRDKKVINTWSRVVERIMRYGNTKTSQYYGHKFKELIGVTWIIENENPDSPDFNQIENLPSDIREVIGATPKSINDYKSIFTNSELPKGLTYTYGNRLLSYPSPEGPFDQIENIMLKELRGSLDTTCAVTTTLVPYLDAKQSLPCIAQIQAVTTKGNLHLLVTARSHDIFKAAIPNAFGLLNLQKVVANKLNIPAGKLQITSESAHIYEQDWDNAVKMSDCFYWSRNPNPSFDPTQEGDPRGNALISIDEGEILINFSGPDGGELMTFKAKTAKEIGRKIAHLDLFGKHGNSLDIGMELQKAEIAIKKKLPYTQDRELSL